MDDSDARAARQAVFDPSTPSEALARIAHDHPGLRGVIAEHPNADAALRATIADLDAPAGDDVAAALSASPVFPRENGRDWPAPSGTPVRPPRRRWPVVVAILVALALVAAGLTYRFVHRTAPDVSPWMAVFGEAGYQRFRAVAVAPDGSIVVVGQAVSLPGAAVVKLSPTGDIVWARQLDGTDQAMFASVAVARDGTVVAAGVRTPTGGPAEALVAEWSGDGRPLWATTLDTLGVPAMLTGVTMGPDGGIVVSGMTASGGDGMPQVSSPAADAVVAHLNADGTAAWTHTYGGSSADVFYDAAVAPDGGIVVAGATASRDGDFPAPYASGPDMPDAVVAWVSPEGILWSSAVVGGFGYDMFGAVVLARDGSVVAGGFTTSTDADFAANTMQSGVAVVASWSSDRTAGWTAFPAATGVGAGLARAADGAITLVGSTIGDSADAFVARLDATGAPAWVRLFGGEDADQFTGVALAPDGDIVAVGMTTSRTGNLPASQAGLDAVAVRLSSDGTTGPG